MKSKEIVRIFIEAVPDLKDEEKIKEAIRKIMIHFMEETNTLIKTRNVKYDTGLIPIFKELETKWNTVRKLLFEHYKIHIITHNVYRIMLQQKLPEAYEYYIQQIKQS